MSKRITATDVADAAGVSVATVSFVLNDRRDIAISEATRRRVCDTAKRLGYRPNLLAKSLLSGRTKTIGVIIPRLDSSFSGRIAQGIQEACLEDDYHVLLSNTLHQSDVAASQLELLLDHQVDGVICVAGEATLPELPKRIDGVLDRGVPCIVVNDRSLTDRVDCVVSDDVPGSYTAVKHLLDSGRRRVAMVGGGPVSSCGRDRLKGYRMALEETSIPFDPNLIVGQSFQSTEAIESIEQLLSRTRRPDAVFAANDEIAAEVLLALRARKMSVPSDIAVIGYADYHIARYLNLTTVRQDSRAMGLRAASRLLERITNPALPPELIAMPTALIIRETCGATSSQAAEQKPY